MLRARTTVAATTAAWTALVVLALPPGADAAVGHFAYLTDAGWSSITNPIGGQCYARGPATWVVNNTDTQASVYSKADCTGESVTIEPGENIIFGDHSYSSVKFAAPVPPPVVPQQPATTLVTDTTPGIAPGTAMETAPGSTTGTITETATGTAPGSTTTGMATTTTGTTTTPTGTTTTTTRTVILRTTATGGS